MKDVTPRTDQEVAAILGKRARFTPAKVVSEFNLTPERILVILELVTSDGSWDAWTRVICEVCDTTVTGFRSGDKEPPTSFSCGDCGNCLTRGFRLEPYIVKKRPKSFPDNG